jgi:DNA-binding transcriptional ArsR family regulator
VVEDPVLDRTYAALADPTRRALLVALRAGEARITDLAAPLPMTFAGVSRHVGVLETAGLVKRQVRGREHWLSLQPEALTLAERWIGEQTSFWACRAQALAARLEQRASPR